MKKQLAILLIALTVAVGFAGVVAAQPMGPGGPGYGPGHGPGYGPGHGPGYGPGHGHWVYVCSWRHVWWPWPHGHWMRFCHWVWRPWF